jgi:hypothetical protein
MFAPVFTVEQRDSVRDHVLRTARNDARVVAGAAVGSLAGGDGDRWSDLDLTFAIDDGAAVGDVLDDWTKGLVDELDAVHLVDLKRGPTTYRVYVLRDSLQLDVSMTPAAQFRVGGPRFELLFGDADRLGAQAAPAAGPPHMFISTPVVASELFGWGVIYALHANACIERGRFWQAEPYVNATRDHALTLACLNRGLRATDARGYDELPAHVLAAFTTAHVGVLEKPALRRALATSIRGLMREGRTAELAHAEAVGLRLADLIRGLGA